MNRKFSLMLVLLLFVYGCNQDKPREYPGYKISNTSIAFKNVNLVPMTDNKIVKAQTVLVKDSKIVAAGSVNDVKIPENAMIIDGKGSYLMPGLADMHMHTGHNWQSLAWPVSPLNLYLANGVTSIRDFGPDGSPADHGLHWRRVIGKGYLEGPTIYTCGKILYGPVDDPVGEVESQKARGFDFIKFYSFLTKEEFNKGMATVKRLNMYSAGHIPYQVGLEGVLSAGMNEIAHIEELTWEWIDFDRSKKLQGFSWIPYVIGTAFQQYEEYKELDIEKLKTIFNGKISEAVEKLLVSKTPVCTTLTLDDVIIQKLHHTDAFIKRGENKYLYDGYLKNFRQGREKHQILFKGEEDFVHFKFRIDRLLLMELKKAGIPLLLATDAGTGAMGLVPGFSLHDELRILIENGLTPYEAITAGTVTASKIVQVMTGKDEFGTIEIGKRADLILLKKNPLENIENIKNPLGVMASGRWYDQKTLQKMLSPEIPTLGEIRHVNKYNTGQSTQIEILVGKDFSGRLPDDITKIVVTGPNGELPICKSDFKYASGLRDFYIEIPGPPDIGTYIFTIYSKEKVGLATDTQSMNIIIPSLVLKTDTFNNENVLQTTTPTLSWKAVKTQNPVFYRLDIFDQNRNRIHRTKSIKNMLSYTIPKGILKPGQTYYWRIRISDSDQWTQEQNRSSSRLWKFSTKT